MLRFVPNDLQRVANKGMLTAEHKEYGFMKAIDFKITHNEMTRILFERSEKNSISKITFSIVISNSLNNYKIVEIDGEAVDKPLHDIFYRLGYYLFDFRILSDSDLYEDPYLFNSNFHIFNINNILSIIPNDNSSVYFSLGDASSKIKIIYKNNPYVQIEPYYTNSHDFKILNIEVSINRDNFSDVSDDFESIIRALKEWYLFDFNKERIISINYINDNGILLPVGYTYKTPDNPYSIFDEITFCELIKYAKIGLMGVFPNIYSLSDTEEIKYIFDIRGNSILNSGFNKAGYFLSQDTDNPYINQLKSMGYDINALYIES